MTEGREKDKLCFKLLYTMERKKQAYNTIKELVNRFGKHIDEYKRGSYNVAMG